MEVKQVPTLGWTRGNVAATIQLVTKKQREDIAQRVREGMQREGLTNAALARRADLAEKTVSRLINAKLEPRYDTLDRVAKALGMSEKDLRGAVGKTPDLSSAGDLDERLASIEQKLDQLLTHSTPMPEPYPPELEALAQLVIQKLREFQEPPNRAPISPERYRRRGNRRNAA